MQRKRRQITRQFPIRRSRVATTTSPTPQTTYEGSPTTTPSHSQLISQGYSQGMSNGMTTYSAPKVRYKRLWRDGDKFYSNYTPIIYYMKNGKVVKKISYDTYKSYRSDRKLERDIYTSKITDYYSDGSIKQIKKYDTKAKGSHREAIYLSETFNYGGGYVESKTTPSPPSRREVVARIEAKKSLREQKKIQAEWSKVKKLKTLAITTPTSDGGTITITRTGKVTLRNNNNKIIGDPSYLDAATTLNYLTTESSRIEKQSVYEQAYPTRQKRVYDILKKQGKNPVIDTKGNIVYYEKGQKVMVNQDATSYLSVPSSAKVSPTAFGMQERLLKRQEQISAKASQFSQFQNQAITIFEKQGLNAKKDRWGNAVITGKGRKIIVDINGNYLDLPTSAKITSNTATSMLGRRKKPDKWRNIENIPQLKKYKSLILATQGLITYYGEVIPFFKAMKDVKAITIKTYNELVKETQKIDRVEMMRHTSNEKGFLASLERGMTRAGIVELELFRKSHNSFVNGKFVKGVKTQASMGLMGAGIGVLSILWAGGQVLKGGRFGILHPIQAGGKVKGGTITTYRWARHPKSATRDVNRVISSMGREIVKNPVGFAAQLYVWNKALQGLGAAFKITRKLSPKFKPSVAGLQLTISELNTTLKGVKLAKQLTKIGTESSDKLVTLRNTWILSRLNKIEPKLKQSIANLQKVNKNPLILKVEMVNPLIETEILIKEIGKIRYVYHTTASKVGDLFGSRLRIVIKEIKEALKTLKKVALEVDRANVINALKKKPYKQLAKSIQFAIKKYELNITEIGEVLKSVYKKLFTKEIIKKLKEPRNIMEVMKPPKQFANPTRYRLGETYLFFDFVVGTYYAFNGLYNIVVPRALRLQLSKSFGFNLLYKRIFNNAIFRRPLNFIKYMTMSKQFTVLELKVRISALPKSLMKRMKQARAGQLSKKEIETLRKELAKWVNNNPQKVTIGGATGTLPKGEREIVLGLGSKLYKKRVRYSIDDATNTFFNVVEVGLKPVKSLPLRKKFNLLLKNLQKLKKEDVITQIKFRFGKTDISRVKTYQKLIKRGNRLSNVQQSKIINIASRVIRNTKKMITELLKKKKPKKKIKRMIGKPRKVKTKVKQVIRKKPKPKRRVSKSIRPLRKPIARISSRKPGVRKPVGRTAVRKPSARTPVRKPGVRKPVGRTAVRKPSARTPVRKPGVRKPVTRTPIRPPVSKPPTKPPIKPPFDEVAKGRGINVYVKKRGMKTKYVRINARPLPLTDARNLGRYIVDNLPLASFRLKIAKGKPQMRFQTKTPALKFRLRKGKTRLPSETKVEKSKYRIDRVLEKQGITIKGLQKLRTQKSILSAFRKAKKTPRIKPRKRRKQIIKKKKRGKR